MWRTRSRTSAGCRSLMAPDSPAACLWSVTSHGSDLLLLIDWQDRSRREQTYFPVGHPERFERMVSHHHAEGRDVRIGLVPRRDQHLDNLAPAQCVWASIENPVSVRNLQAFQPKPTLVFKQGRKRVAIWWLQEPLPMVPNPEHDWVTRANRRLAYALKANSRHADPAWLMPLGELETADPSRMYTPARVVGRLQDAPVRVVPSRRS